MVLVTVDVKPRRKAAGLARNGQVKNPTIMQAEDTASSLGGILICWEITTIAAT
jgi:hypothetical protein